MFDQLIHNFIAHYDILIFATLALVIIGLFFKMPFTRIMQYCALFYCGATTLILTFSDGATEIPVAEIMAQYKYGFIALVGLTIGIKAYCVAVGFYHFDLGTKLFFNFAVIPYSVLISVVGQNIIYADGDVKKNNNQQQISDYVIARDELMYGKYGLEARNGPSCAEVPTHICKSADIRQEINNYNSKIAALRFNASVSSDEALAPVVAMISKIFKVSIDAATLLLFVAFLRTWVATYATMIMSRMTAQCYWALTGHWPKKSGIFGPKSGQNRAKSGPGILRAIFKTKKGKRASKITNDEILAIVGQYCIDEEIPKKRVNRPTVQKAMVRERSVGINNDRATEIARLYKKAVDQNGLTT